MFLTLTFVISLKKIICVNVSYYANLSYRGKSLTVDSANLIVLSEKMKI